MAEVRKRTWVSGGILREAWYWRYKDAGGTMRQSQHANKHVMDDFKRKTEAEMAAGTHVAARASITVAEAAAIYLEDAATRVSAVTLEGYRNVINKYIVPRLGTKRLVQLTSPTVQYYINNMRDDGCPPNQIHKAKHLLGQILELAGSLGKVGHNIVKSLPPRMPKRESKELPIPTKDELRLILARTLQRKENHGYKRMRTHVLIHFAMLTGLRQGEIRALRWTNLDLEDGWVHVRQSLDKWGNVKKPKTAKGIRSVPISQDHCKLLKMWKRAQPPSDTGYVFTTKYGTPMGPNSVASLWVVHLYHCGFTHWPGPGQKPLSGEKKKYGQPNFRFHDLRHVCASLWIDQRIDLKALQVYIGHASVQLTLDRYGHLLASREEAGAAVFRTSDQFLTPKALQIVPGD